MNAEIPKSPFDTLLRKRVETITIDFDGIPVDIELREQPMGEVQAIISEAAADEGNPRAQTKMLERLMGISLFINGEQLGEERAAQIGFATFIKLAPARDKMLLAYGLKEAEEPETDEKKESTDADDSPGLFDPNSS